MGALPRGLGRTDILGQSGCALTCRLAVARPGCAGRNQRRRGDRARDLPSRSGKDRRTDQSETLRLGRNGARKRRRLQPSVQFGGCRHLQAQEGSGCELVLSADPGAFHALKRLGRRSAVGPAANFTVDGAVWSESPRSEPPPWSARRRLRRAPSRRRSPTRFELATPRPPPANP